MRASGGRVSVTAAEILLATWAPVFGFGHYRQGVSMLSRELWATDDSGVWGRSRFDHTEEWILLEVVEDGYMPPRQLEWLVLHELSHGLLSYASTSPNAEEVACNRVAAMHLGPAATGPNYHHARSAFEGPLAVAIATLPPRERAVIQALYVDGLSLREVTRLPGLGFPVDVTRSVRRCRDRALTLLRHEVIR